MKRERPKQDRHVRYPPFTDKLPAPVYFRIEHMPAHATYPELRHDWGEFVYAFSGVTEVAMAGQNFLAPPHMGLWIPAETSHIGFNQREAVHCSVYISREICGDLPDAPCSIMISPLVRAILDCLRETADQTSAPSVRLLRVLVDQLADCPRTGSFVPHSTNAELEPILSALRSNPSDNRSLAELAKAFGFSERTLVRRCERELGMSLMEWRQRLRVVTALPLLRGGQTVEAVALDLGYATSSAFIAMFRRLTGSSPRLFVERLA